MKEIVVCFFMDATVSISKINNSGSSSLSVQAKNLTTGILGISRRPGFSGGGNT
jgi:hypothetical protein